MFYRHLQNTSRLGKSVASGKLFSVQRSSSHASKDCLREGHLQIGAAKR